MQSCGYPRPGRTVRAQRGATLLEFSLVMLFGLLPLSLALLQVVLLLSASHVLALAGFAAVRVGATTGGSRVEMTRELARALVPLYVAHKGSAKVAPLDLAAAYERASLRQAQLGRLEIVTPTRRQFDQFGVLRDAGRAIPNEALEFRSIELQQANMLGIDVTHCVPLLVPLIDRALTSMLAVLDSTELHQRCYLANAVPLRTQAHLPMQSDARLELLYP